MSRRARRLATAWNSEADADLHDAAVDQHGCGGQLAGFSGESEDDDVGVPGWLCESADGDGGIEGVEFGGVG